MNRKHDFFLAATFHPSNERARNIPRHFRLLPGAINGMKRQMRLLG